MAKIEATGNLGQDAELKVTQNGATLLSFSVGDNKSKRLPDGSFEKIATQWLRCTLWGDDAEYYEPKLKQGTRVTVYGEFYARQYESDKGPGTSLDVTVRGLTVWPSRKGDQQGQQQGQGGFTQSNQPNDPWGQQTPPQGSQQGWGESWGQPDSPPPF